MKGKEIRITSLLILDTAFFLLEAIVGYSVHSLALVADSFHMLNDIVSLIIALWAVKIKNNKPADSRYTYGWQRAEILGALINAVFLLALCFSIILDALQRFFQPQVVEQPKLVLIVGSLGLLSNCVGLVLFHEHGHSHGHSHSEPPVAQHYDENSSNTDLESYFPENVLHRMDENSSLISKGPKAQEENRKKKRSLNMEGVFLHVLGDALGNIGVIMTALFIWKTDYSWRFYTDPLVSLVITGIIFSSALPLCRRSSKILLQATPSNIDSTAVLKAITELPSVKSIHDFHVWNLNEDILIASMHLGLADIEESQTEGVSPHINQDRFNKIVSEVREVLHRFGIHSATIQPEFPTSQPGFVSNSTLNVYAHTNSSNCVIDGTTCCDNDQCLNLKQRD